MIRRYATALHVGLMAFDALSAMALFVIVSQVVAATIHGGADWHANWHAAGVDPIAGAAAYAAAWVGLLWLQGLYRVRIRFSLRLEFLDILRSGVLLAIGTFALLFILKLPELSRFFLVALFATQVVWTTGSRLALRLVLRWLRTTGRNTRFVVVIGTGPDAVDFTARVERRLELGLRVVGYVSVSGQEADPRLGHPVLGTIDRIEAILHERVVDEVAICLPIGAIELVEPLTRLCEEEGKIVRIPRPPAGLVVPGGRLETLDDVPVLSLVYGPDRAIALLLKRATDVTLSAIALVLLSPVFAAIAGAILVLDGRPILFRQTRVGLHGRPFRVVKFRTMAPDAEARLDDLLERNELHGQAFKLSDDPRVSRTGRWLRRTSLDELPQFWNSLVGDMSIVGPRPPLPREVDGYDLWHRRRLSMKPGITGLWQVSARHEEDFDRWVELDLDYIDRWSLWLDLKIMARTVPAMVQGR